MKQIARLARTALQGGEHAHGTPESCVDPDGRGTSTTRIAGPSLAVGAILGAPGADRLDVRRRTRRQGRGPAPARDRRDGKQMAWSIRARSARWAVRRTAAGCPADRDRRTDRAGDYSDIGNDAAWRDALEY